MILNGDPVKSANARSLTDGAWRYLIRACVGLAIYFVSAVTVIALVTNNLVLIPGGVAFVAIAGMIITVSYRRSRKTANRDN
jgi:Flp pilus assembly protein TadB